MGLEKYRGQFIVFEGHDSTGKTSVANEFVSLLNGFGIKTIFTYQPGDTSWGPIASLTRSLCKDKRWNLSEWGNLFAFLLDRAENVDKTIRPALKEGTTVVCDRFTYSTVAYQLFGKKLIEELIEEKGKEQAMIIMNWLKKPYFDLRPIVYYFPEKVGQRIHDPNDLFENSEHDFSERVNNAYNEMAALENWKIVKPGEDVKQTLDNLLKL